MSDSKPAGGKPQEMMVRYGFYHPNPDEMNWMAHMAKQAQATDPMRSIKSIFRLRRQAEGKTP